MLKAPSEWILETVHLLLMDKSDKVHLTLVLISRVFMVGFIILPLAAAVYGVYERAKQTAHWDMAGIGKSRAGCSADYSFRLGFLDFSNLGALLRHRNSASVGNASGICKTIPMTLE